MSALCVTHRPQCYDWLRWNVQRQTYPRLEVVVVDGSSIAQHGPRDFVWTEDQEEELEARAGRLICAGADLSCGQLRNIAMAHARGDYFVWFDDDDWQHPERVEWLVEEIQRSGTLWAGWACGYLMDLGSLRSVFLPNRVKPPRVINGGAIYRTEECRKIKYDDQPMASDARWLRQITAWYNGEEGHALLDDRLHAIWTRHARNTSASGFSMTYPLSLDELARKAHGWWGTTERRLRALQAALE